MRTVTLDSNRIHTGSLILVNAQHPYREEFSGHKLSPVNDSASDILLESNTVRLLSDVMDKLDGWEQIAAVSGWRSMQEQTDIYEQSLKDNGKAFTEQFVALPGCSEHQTGLAIDLGIKQENIDFIRPDFPYTGICRSFRRCAVSYGFIERYPKGKESITGIAHEPWHFRYVGAPHAAIMMQYNFVLEEYLSFLKGFSYGRESYIHRIGDMRIAISYLKAQRTSDTVFEIDDNASFTVSGNNIDGFIITEWRKQNVW